jgi:chromosome partitioning protein
MVITIANEKGGCGKTASALNLAVLIARRGQRVLVADLDSQCTFTRQIGIDPGAVLSRSLVDVLAGTITAGEATIADVADVAGLDVIPAGVDLAGVEMGLRDEIERERYQQDALEPVLDAYDHVIVDCPPNRGLLVVNALVCAGTVLAPVSCEDEASVQGLVQLRATIAKLERLRGSRPRLVSLLTRWQPHRVLAEVVEGTLVQLDFAPIGRIPARAIVDQAAADQVPVAISAPDSAVAIAYERALEQLAEEPVR